MRTSFLFHSQFLFIGHWSFIIFGQRSPLSHADNQSALRPFLLSQYTAKLLGEVALTISPRHRQGFSLSKLQHFATALPRFFFQGFSSSKLYHNTVPWFSLSNLNHNTLSRHLQGFSSSNLYHNTSPRFFFIKFISQVRLCKVLAMWPKVTADWLVTLSAVTRSLANCLLRSASTCELWAMEEATATTEVKKIEVFSCTVGAFADAVGPIWSQLQE